MSDVWLSIVMVIVFVLIGGFFSGTEIALISLRESQVRALSETGPARARPWASSWPIPTASSPPCRSASPWPAASRRPRSVPRP